MTSRLGRIQLCLVSVGLFGVAASAAQAAGFDVVTGTVDVRDAAFSVTFESDAELAATGVQGFDYPDFAPIELAKTQARRTAGGIEGDFALALGGDHIYTTLPLGAADLAGERVEVVLWQRPLGTRVSATLTWYGAAGTSEPPFLGSVALLPTGRATDDGWEEWSTGPFDWAWAGAVGPSTLTFVDDQLFGLYVGGSYDEKVSTLVDALHVRSVGAATVPSSACTLLDERTVCGDDGLCHLGRCVDATLRTGAAALTDPQWRADYIDRRFFELDLFEGGRAPQAKMESIRDLLAHARTTEHARDFWGTLKDAYTLLEDGHASAPMMGYPPMANGGVCLAEGVADLLPGSPILPLVFSTTQDNPIAAQLELGDALVAIDGVDPATWLASAARVVFYNGDEDARQTIVTGTLFGAALDVGAELTFARCAGPAPCAAGEETAVVLDLAVVGDEVLAGLAPDALAVAAACDFRFKRPVAGNVDDVTAYEFAAFDDDDGIRSLLINGVPTYYGQGGAAWFNVVEDALASGPDRLLLDQRTGGGGGVDAVDWIAGMLLEEGAVYGMDFLPAFDQGEDDATMSEIESCMTNPQAYDCGSSFRWVLGDVADPPRGAAADSKLAVLSTFDVSGNDYLSQLITEREAGETRIFGPADTFGAFGVVWSLPNHLGELSGGSFQVHDTRFLQTANDRNLDFVTSSGVPPDEVIRQKQSDAVAGRDTLIEAARAWLNQN